MSSHTFSTPPQRPSGTVTFLFTDIEASTRLWEQYPEWMRAAFARHEAIVRDVVRAYGGYAYKMIGDAFQVAFQSAYAALEASIAIQRALAAEPWGDYRALKVRMALHTGSVEERDDDYVGPLLNRVARVMAAGHGGQILLTEITAGLVQATLNDEVSMRALGLHHLKGLIQPERIFQVVAHNLRDTFPPLNAAQRGAYQLPVPLTTLLGRESEIHAIRELLQPQELRLLTLTGPGGIGKTRLALEVARQLQTSFQDGAFFVPLAPVTERARIISAIARVLKVQEDPGVPLTDSLTGFLLDKELLLVLDNFEQIVDSGPLISELLTASPWVTVLVTSRERLNLYGEQTFEVPPLALPDLHEMPPLDGMARYAAVTLFVQRARTVMQGFHLTVENLQTVSEICTRLEGLPLAIELAAARIGIFTPQAMLAEIGNRFELLAHGPRDFPVRQQTLRGAIDWSYNLLDAGDRHLFARLALFVGGFSSAAAEALCNVEGNVDVVSGLYSLLNKSLLRQQDEAEGELRFTMLEMIGEYAREKLPAVGVEHLRRAHARCYVELEPTPRNLEVEYDNVRAALAWAVAQQETVIAMELVCALWGGRNQWHQGEHYEEARHWLEKVMAMEQNAQDALRAKVYGAAGTLLWIQGDFAESTRFHEWAMQLHEGADDKPAIVGTLNNLGVQAYELGDYDRSVRLLERSVAVARDLGNEWQAAVALQNLGEAERCRGNLTRAKTCLDACLPGFTAAEDHYNIASTLHNMGQVQLRLNQLAEADAAFHDSLARFQQLGLQDGMASCLAGLAGLAGARNQPASAAWLYGAFAAFQKGVGFRMMAADRLDYKLHLALARAQLDDALWQSSYAEGSKMTLAEACRSVQSG